MDQWRIYADFLQIYGIDLAFDEIHWWKFCGLLWNLPYKQSSFLQVIDIRQKEIKSDMGKEQKEAIQNAQSIYALDQPEIQKEYTPEEISKIDDYDRMMEEIRAKKKAETELGLC